jgi:hypothetical protein
MTIMDARPQFSAVTFFCEWIHEPSGSATPSYIGQMPLNVSLGGEIPPKGATVALLPSLGVVTILNLPVEAPIQAFTLHIRGNWPAAPNISQRFEGATLKAEFDKARSQGNAYLGYFIKANISPFPGPLEQGRLEVVVDAGGSEILSGEMFFRRERPAQ